MNKKKTKLKDNQLGENAVVEDSTIRKTVKILGTYLWKKCKEYSGVIFLDIIVFLLLFFLIPTVILEVKPYVWMIAFAIFTIFPTIGFYGLKKFRDKQITFGILFIYILILLVLDKCKLLDLYGITSLGDLDYTPAYLDAVFVTFIIVFLQYIGILCVNLSRSIKKKKKIKKFR